MKFVRSIWRISVQEMLIYRMTSVLTVALAAVFFGIELLAGTVFFSAGNINGWSNLTYALLIATVSTAVYIYNIFFIVGHENLAEDILEGNLDYLFLRPRSSYWFASMSRMDIPSVVNLAISLIVVIVDLVALKITLLTGVLYIVALINVVVFIFLLNKIAITLTFWLDGFTALGGVIEDAVDLLSRPTSIFPRLIQLLFTFVIPVLLIVNLPVEVLTVSSTSYVLLAYSIGFNIILYLISKSLWRRGVRHYVSAN